MYDTTWYNPNINIQLECKIWKVELTKGVLKALLKFDDDDANKRKKWPAVVCNINNKGKTVLFTFKPKLDESSSQEDLHGLLQRALEYIEPNEIHIKPLNIVPVRTIIKADRAVDLIAWENYSNSLELINTNGTISGYDQIRWDLKVSDSTDIKIVTSSFRLPDEKGIYTIPTFIQFLSKNKWRSYNTTEIKFEVKETIDESIENVKKDLGMLPVKNIGLIKDLIKIFEKVQKDKK
ncbi:hypothetical protein HY745_03960, partial [Candidatus Desantisbacteria bacterium]|nr:hypothetical protein [Candidatus Desantisbacteria bacterium]